MVLIRKDMRIAGLSPASVDMKPASAGFFMRFLHLNGHCLDWGFPVAVSIQLQ